MLEKTDKKTDIYRKPYFFLLDTISCSARK